jgi:hypothetical protein
MNPQEINKLLLELDELAELDDPAFTARTQSKRVYRKAAEAIRALTRQVRRLNARLKALEG